jgi:DNA polymerase IV
MVDSAINWLFVDLNSYFASIEQELCPELRGQPIAIVPSLEPLLQAQPRW